MSENDKRILLPCLTALVVVYWSIPLIRLSYQAGLTGLPSGPLGTGVLTAPVLSFGQSFLLALVMAVLLVKLLEHFAIGLRFFLAWILCLEPCSPDCFRARGTRERPGPCFGLGKTEWTASRLRFCLRMAMAV